MLWGAEPHTKGMLIPGLPNDLALFILVRLPRAHHGTLRRVSRAWHAAFSQTEVVTALRNTLCVSETCIVFAFDDDRTLEVYHPPLQCLSSPLPFPAPQLSPTPGALHTVHMLSAFGTSVFFKETLTFMNFQEVYIHCLDVVSMKCHADPAPLPRPGFITALWDFSSMIIDGCVYIIGGYVNHNSLLRKHSKQVQMLDLQTMTWKMLPDMQERRYKPVGVVWEGRLCVMGNPLNESVNCGEAWEPQSGWTPVQELWPLDMFKAQLRHGARVAVVMDVLYTLRTHDLLSTGRLANHADLELMYYESATMSWTSLGLLPSFPLRYPACKFCGPYYCTHFLGMGQELWVLIRCSCTLVTHGIIEEVLLSCIPTRHPPLSWTISPISFQNGAVPSSSIIVKF